MQSKDISVIRQSIGKIVSMLTNQSIAVTQRGTDAYVQYDAKGVVKRVNIPYLADDATPGFIAAVQGFLDHEVGHVLFTDPKVLLAAKKQPGRTANLHNTIEDVYVERKMSEAFAGSGGNLDALRFFYLNDVVKKKVNEAVAAGNETAASGYAAVVKFRAWGGQLAAIDFLKNNPKIDALAADIESKLGPAFIKAMGQVKSSKEALDLAKQAYDLLKPAPPPAPVAPSPPSPAPPPVPAPPADDEEEQDEGAGDGPAPTGSTDQEEQGEADPTVPSGASGDQDEEPSSASVSAAEDDSGKQRDDDDENGETDMDSDTAGTGGESDTDVGENQEPTVPEEASPSEGDDAPPDDEEQPSDDQEEQVGPMVTHAGAKSGEHAPGDQGDLSEAFEQPMDFDSDVAKQLSQNAKKELSHSQYRVFSTDWDTLKSAPLGDHKAVEVMVKVTDHMVAGIQKSLERAMAAKARKTWSGGQRRGRINPGSLFRTAVGDDRVFRKRYETAAKNTAVTLLVDCSGSMSGERLALAAQAAYALSSTLERLKIKNEVLGFTTEGCKEMALAISRESNAYDFYSRSSSIYMPLFKGFDERLTIDAKLRLAALTNKPMWLRENVDGESVQIAANRLRKQVAERHVLIVLSDGIPACEGTSAALSNHLKRVVLELPSQGVEVVGIGIQTTDVAMFYPRNLTLNNIESLPVTVVNELSRLLLAV